MRRNQNGAAPIKFISIQWSALNRSFYLFFRRKINHNMNPSSPRPPSVSPSAFCLCYPCYRRNSIIVNRIVSSSTLNRISRRRLPFSCARVCVYRVLITGFFFALRNRISENEKSADRLTFFCFFFVLFFFGGGYGINRIQSKVNGSERRRRKTKRSAGEFWGGGQVRGRGH